MSEHGIRPSHLLVFLAVLAFFLLCMTPLVLEYPAVGAVIAIVATAVTVAISLRILKHVDAFRAKRHTVRGFEVLPPSDPSTKLHDDVPAKDAPD